MAGVPSLNTSARTACILGFALNVVLTGLTAGRIVWIQRKSASTLSDDDVTRSRCTRATKIILESGLIYCVVALFIVVSFSINEEWLRIGFGLAAQLMNIVPTFTLVGSGKCYENNRVPFDKASAFSSTSACGGAIATTVVGGSYPAYYNGRSRSNILNEWINCTM
ncbi:hypothetical protein R3P38DRAFT_3364393 [Favolaschia claudopus]|uniref:Vomeronasal type 2 receptor n=1 Tax=Favolaschia claudopus TaxID=2862362 RepID=A0AAW0AIJ0_9AGAR